jgi:hypothetical protein
MFITVRGVSTMETVNAGCSGTSGTGSNCIDMSFSINTGGTYGTTAALATCGVNNLQGSAANYATRMGVCINSGVGDIVRDFRIGTQQNMLGLVTDSVYDDGADAAGGAFNQNAAFSCNIVAATVVQCVKGPTYSNGTFSSIGQWSTAATFIEYGDMTIGTGAAAAASSATSVASR